MPQKTPPALPMGGDPYIFSDYGFDPDIDYFQLQQKVIEEHQRRKRGGKREARKAAAEAVRFKLQKPISKDHPSSSGSNKGKKRPKWWRNCIQFLKNRWGTAARTDQISSGGATKETRICCDGPASIGKPEPPSPVAPMARPPLPPPPRPPPLYTVDAGSSLYVPAPCRTTRRRRFGFWLWSPLKVAEMMPYQSLRELGLLDDDDDDDDGGNERTGHRLPGAPSSHMPIYLVT